MNKSVFLKARNLSYTDPFHLPPSAQKIGSKIVLVLENVSPQSEPEIIMRDRLRDFSWRIKMFNDGKRYITEIMLPSEPTIVYYHFEFSDKNILLEHRQIERANGPNSPIYGEYEYREFQIAVYDPAAMPAKWTQGMIIYQIFLDRFAKGKIKTIKPQYDTYGQAVQIKKWHEAPEAPPRGRDFFGGDFQGLIQKLHYLKKLGVDCIYLSPIFDAPTNHRYDTNNYLKIAPMLGSEEEFIELIQKVHDREMYIILEAVYNHCSCDSIYFDMPGRCSGAYHNKQSPYYRWFSFKKWPNEYQRWWGHQRYPEFVECPEVEDFFLGPDGITAYWFEKGIDGWRTDATRFNSDLFWRRFRKKVNSLHSNAYLVCEEWEDASHYLVGDMFNATMNYRFTWALQGFFADGQLTTSQFEDRLATLRRDIPQPALLSQMNLISSHDIRRALSACNEDKQKFMQIVAFQMSYPGAPTIYYGDEVAIVGEDGESGRKPYPWGAEDKTIFIFYQKILTIRQNLPALREGIFEPLIVDDERRIYAFLRQNENQTVYAIFNASDKITKVNVEITTNHKNNWTNVLDFKSDIIIINNTIEMKLPPRGFAWCTQEV